MIGISFDVEPDLKTNEYKGITEGIPRIIKILDKYKIKATFFVTCDCLERYPRIFQDLQRQGNEIALHGYRHKRFDSLTEKEKERDIKESIEVFKKYLNIKPKGFRAPQHSIDSSTLNLLEKYDFKYDSSYTPLNLLQLFFFPFKKQSYLHFFSPINKYKIDKIYELPVSSFFFPAVSLLFRSFPFSFIRIYSSFLKIICKNQILYFHSWDFIDVRGKIAKAFPKEKLINNLDKFLGENKEKFSKLIELI